MRILRIIRDVSPASGGPIEGLKVSSQVLADMGHHSEVLTLEDPDSDHLASFPFKVHAIGSGLGRYGYNGGLDRWIRSNAHRFDVAVVHGLWNHAAIGGWRALKSCGLPYVVFTHGMMDPWFRSQYPIKHLAKQMYWFALQGRVLRDASKVLFTSEEEMYSSRNIFWGHKYRESVVSYGSTQPSGEIALQKEAFYAASPTLPKGRRFLLFLSRIHVKKGCDLLLEAFAHYAEQFPEVDLVVAGPDQEGLTDSLKAFADRSGISDRVHWPGLLTGNAKWGAYRSADAFILPSHQENFGIVVAEALACDTPVLVTNKVNIWREVVSGGGGLVENDTLDGIKRLLEQWLQYTRFGSKSNRICSAY